MTERKIEISIVDNNPEINLTNLNRLEAIALLQLSLTALMNKTLQELDIQLTQKQQAQMPYPNTSQLDINKIKQQFPKDPIAKTMADLVTPKQLVAIRAIANSQGVNAETECLEALKCRPEELSRRAASAFIDHLKGKKNDEGQHITEKQLSAIYAIANAKSLDAQLESMALFKCEPEQLNQQQSTELTEHLQNIRVSEGVPNSLCVSRGKTIAAMGMVERDYDGFNVVLPGIKKESFRVWRDEENRIRCSCSEFQERGEKEPRFRCEHIFAVKFYLEPDEEKAV